MKYIKTFENYNTPQCAQEYNKGEEIVFIEDYDDKLKRGGVFKITNVDDNMITIENEDGIIAEVEFDGEVEKYFKKSFVGNDDIDSDHLLQ